MARLFSIPAGFEFLTARSDWTNASAQILGWEEKANGSLDTDYLTAELVDGPSAGQVFRMELGHLPEDLWDKCARADESSDIQGLCAGFTPTLLVNAIKLPLPYPSGKGYRIGDPWLMRDEFVRMSPTAEGVIAFLNRWGCWSSPTITILDEVLEARERLRVDLVSPPESWLRQSLWFLGHMTRTPRYPYSLIRTEKCAVAIRLVTTMDFLSKVRFKKCARPDCNNPFEVKSGHGQTFCQQYCAHLVSMRRTRNKAKKKRIVS